MVVTTLELGARELLIIVGKHFKEQLKVHGEKMVCHIEVKRKWFTKISTITFIYESVPDAQ